MINIKEQLSESDIFNRMSEDQQATVIATIKETCNLKTIELKTVKIEKPSIKTVCIPCIVVCINDEITVNTGILLEDI